MTGGRTGSRGRDRRQLERPFVVDHSKFAKAFGAQVTPHPDAIRITLAWFAGTGAVAAN
jgi:hypothetical protein